MDFLKIKKTNSQIVQSQNNIQKSKQKIQYNKSQTKQNILQSEQMNQIKSQYFKKTTVYDQNIIRNVTTQSKYSKVKLPKSIKQALQLQAKQSGKYKQKDQQTKKSKFGSIITSRLKKQQISCSICLALIKKQQMCEITNCKHIFCNDCLQQYITYKIKMFQQVLCPDQQCDMILDQNCQTYKKLSEQLRKQYQKIHLFYLTSNDPTLRLCPKQNCEGLIKIIQDQPKICTKCYKQFCGKCYFQKHEGQCDKHQIQFFQNNLNFRQCTNCGIVVQRIQGCNHITCKCKYEFCYLCGNKWPGYDHRCNNSNVNNGIFQQDNLCECCECTCLNNICGDTCADILKFPLKLILTLIFLIVVIIIVINSLCYCLFYLLISIICGMIGYSSQFVCDLCDQDRVLLAAAMIILFPIPIFIGICKAMSQIFCQLAGQNCNQMSASISSTFQSIWG